ncbi:hypothetical protein BIW11_05529 [Tropilaelaps mercedesae]|uniref:Uncharacterized protein n=1 Tax=Tropilaelaps mercedesae TaxID=418985 RepID=A0A1V9Y1W8_9ACAR|nr:hypothetical protein BIW11_05529 [Tropilaelaps mercedesae]
MDTLNSDRKSIEISHDDNAADVRCLGCSLIRQLELLKSQLREQQVKATRIAKMKKELLKRKKDLELKIRLYALFNDISEGVTVRKIDEGVSLRPQKPINKQTQNLLDIDEDSSDGEGE